MGWLMDLISMIEHCQDLLAEHGNLDVKCETVLGASEDVCDIEAEYYNDLTGEITEDPTNPDFHKIARVRW